MSPDSKLTAAACFLPTSFNSISRWPWRIKYQIITKIEITYYINLAHASAIYTLNLKTTIAQQDYTNCLTPELLHKMHERK